MYLFFFFNDTATTEIYTLSLHDALPISGKAGKHVIPYLLDQGHRVMNVDLLPLNYPGVDNLIADITDSGQIDRKSTRLNSSHANISYAVFCLKKKKKTNSI